MYSLRRIYLPTQRIQPLPGDPDFLQMHSAVWQVATELVMSQWLCHLQTETRRLSEEPTSL